MKYEVIATEQAENDLMDVYEYIAFELLASENAEGQLDRLEKAIIGLENYPKKFRQYEKEPWHGRGLRVMPVDNYLVFYIPDDKVATVTIVRVMYAGRDVDEQLAVNTDYKNEIEKSP